MAKSAIFRRNIPLPNFRNLCKALAPGASHPTEKDFRRISPGAVGSGFGVGSGMFRRYIADLAKFLKSMQKVGPGCIPPDREGCSTDFTESRRKRRRHRKRHIPPIFRRFDQIFEIYAKSCPRVHLGNVTVVLSTNMCHRLNTVGVGAGIGIFAELPPNRPEIWKIPGKLPPGIKIRCQNGNFLGYDPPSDLPVFFKTKQQNLGHAVPRMPTCFKLTARALLDRN